MEVGSFYGDSELWPTEPSEFAEETLIYAIDSFFVVLWPLSHLVFKKKPGKVKIDGTDTKRYVSRVSIWTKYMETVPCTFELL